MFNRPKSKSSTAPVEGNPLLNSLGLTTVVDPGPAKRNIDLIFIHGLDGLSHTTWSLDGKPELFWPKEWLPQERGMETARIMIWGYHAPSEPFSAGSDMTIPRFATNLLNALVVNHVGQIHPVVFVCYSMGGLIAKQAVISGSADPKTRHIIHNVKGVVFFATPHHGADLTKTDASIDHVFRALRLSNIQRYIGEVAPKSDRIEDINREFRHHLDRLFILSFYEECPTSRFGDVVIVSRASAVLESAGETSCGIHADHFSICKFPSSDSPQYKVAAPNISRFIQTINLVFSPNSFPAVLYPLALLLYGDELSIQRARSDVLEKAKGRVGSTVGCDHELLEELAESKWHEQLMERVSLDLPAEIRTSFMAKMAPAQLPMSTPNVSSHNHGSDSAGLHILRKGVSLGAIHDSAERDPAANCHPDTRKAVRQIILDWIQSESSESFFFWLYGPAGAGKTAILQAIAEFLCNPSESDQNFGGSFFFSRGKHGRDQGHFLFSTIAYQLALKVPGLRHHVNHIVELDPSLHTKSMDVQLRTLIVDAFRNLSPRPRHSYLVVIDGLDECHDKAAQQTILRLKCEAITVHKLPLRFLVGSRPESHIRASFDQESLYTITHRVVLDETFNPGRDIEVFLRDGFAKICAENSILAHAEQPWPRKGIIDFLVQRSSGQFIYAATVLRFVGADFCSPTKQLALVLKPDPTAFSDLDHLYTQILSVYPSSVNIVQVLGIIITCQENNNPQVIEDILEMEKGELKLVLRGLSSLMDGNLRENFYPPFAHASFRDYLFNSSRSGLFHVNRQGYESQVTIRSFAPILQSFRFWRRSSITRVLHAATWNYFTSHLPDHFFRSPNVVKEAIMTDINDLLQEFWKTSTDEVNGESIIAMRLLDEILRQCLEILLHPNSWHYYANLESDLDDRITVKFTILLDEYRKMLDQYHLNPKI